MFEKLNAEARIQKTMDHPKAAYTAAEVDRLKALLYSQFDDIDALLNTSSAKISYSETPATLLFEQNRKKKAPYTKPGKDVLADAVIFYSSLEYCKTINLADIYFVTSNHTEYSISTERKEELHPDYKEVYPQIQIHYHGHIANLFTQLEGLGIHFTEGRQNDSETEQSDTSSIFIDRRLPILDQVYYYLNEVFDELSIIPKKFFSEQYPFIILERFNYYHLAYTIVTDNVDIYDLLQVQIDGDNVHDPSMKFIHTEEDKKKINFIFRILLRNWIQQVSFKNQQSFTFKAKGHRKTCRCVHCNWRGLRWVDTISQLYPITKSSNPPNEIADELKNAFVQYRLGDFKGSAESFFRIYAMHELFDIRKYIIAFNLKKIRSVNAA